MKYDMVRNELRRHFRFVILITLKQLTMNKSSLTPTSDLLKQLTACGGLGSLKLTPWLIYKGERVVRNHIRGFISEKAGFNRSLSPLPVLLPLPPHSGCTALPLEIL